MSTFSERHGMSLADAEITVRNDAPEELRGVLVQLAYGSGYTPKALRELVCRVLFKRPDSSNWSDYPNIDQEIRGLLDECIWWDVYNVIEAVAKDLASGSNAFAHSVFGHRGDDAFASELNRYFKRAGIGWQLVDGILEMRGTEAFEAAVRETAASLTSVGKMTAANELHEAIADLSRRPTPEVTGAIQHALAALECLARDVGHSKDTLGALLRQHPELFPSPLGSVVDKAWGWASNNGRHLQEEQPPSFEEAELMVGLSGALCRYLKHKLS
jgi:hypothetical protein